MNESILISVGYDRNDDSLPLFPLFTFPGNTTVFEYKTGTRPTRIMAPEVGLEEEGAQGEAAEEEDIDWGDLDLDGAGGKG